MCGIFGYVRPLDEAPCDLGAALSALRHRGPDGEGTHEATGAAVRCGLAHTRLSILDLSTAAAQPMTAHGGRYSMVYNGEVYNFADVRRELEALGDTFQSSGDTEVVLKAFVRWGPDCLRRLRGMFAFAVFDARTGALFLARDRLGVKPLYYAAKGRSIAFASEIRALLATGTAERKLSPAGLSSYLAFGSVSEPDTILEGVRMLPAGACLEHVDGRSTVRSYWHVPYEAASDSGPRDFESAVEDLRPVLRDAVKLRLIADVPVGVFLSGGIDSSAVAALAAAASEGPVRTFTVSFDERAYDEARFAESVARRLGCEHREVHFPASRAQGEVERAVRALDQPSADGVNSYFVSLAVREAGLKVALSGLGGDELFAGYPRFRSFGRLSALASLASALPSAASGALGALGGRAELPTAARKLLALTGTGGAPGAVYGVLRGMFSPDERRTLVRQDFPMVDAGVLVPPGLAGAASAGRRLDAVNAYGSLEMGNYLRNTLLRDTDVMSMANALEVRVPLVDHVLVEHASRVRGALKLRRGQNKPLLVAATPPLPDEAVRRPKMGFTLPFAAWFRGPLRGYMEESLLGEPVLRAGFLDPRGTEALWRSFLRGERYASYARVHCISALARWCHQNGVGA